MTFLPTCLLSTLQHLLPKSIITRFSAAHCFWSKGSFAQTHNAANAYIVAGKHDLRYFESASQKRDLIDVIIHPDWNSNAVNFDADIAVGIMKYPIFYTDKVQPVCLPNYNAVLIHPMGKVVGKFNISSVSCTSLNSYHNELTTKHVQTSNTF